MQYLYWDSFVLQRETTNKHLSNEIKWFLRDKVYYYISNKNASWQDVFEIKTVSW